MNAAVRHGAELVVTAGAIAVLSFAYVIVCARSLGPDAYADLWAALSVIYFVGLAVSPVGPAVSRIVATHENPAAVRRMLMRKMQLAAVALVVLSFAAARPAMSLLRMKSVAPLLLAGVVVAIYAFAMFDRGILQGAMEMRRYNANALLEVVLRVGFAAVVLRFHATSSAAIAAYAAALAIAEGILATTLTARTSGAAELPQTREVLRLGAPIVVLMIALAVYQCVDTFVVKRWFSAADAGVYGAAAALARTFTVIVAPLYVLAIPLLTRARHRASSLLASGAGVCGAYLAIAAIPFALFAVAPRLVIDLLYGPAYAGAAPILPRLSLIAIAGNLALLLAQVVISAGRSAFLWLYAAVAVAEVVALSFRHATIGEVIVVALATQVVVLAVVAAALLRTIAKWNARQITQAGSGSSAA